VSILTYKHPLKKGIEKMEELTEKTTTALHEVDVLHKSIRDSAGAANLLRKLEEAARLVDEMQQLQARNAVALRDYEAWIENQAGLRDYGSFTVCEKGLTESGEHRLSPFSKQKSAPRDLGAEAADAMLRHRTDLGNN
jgi:hypothetical protein